MAGTKMSAAEIEKLVEENKRLKEAAEKGKTFSLKVSGKGAVSVYGMGRFPVTLYQEQWETVLSHADDIRRFIADNKSKLKAKDSNGK